MLILNFVLCLKSINLLDHFTDCQRIWDIPSPDNHRTRACLKKAFCKMCVTICGIFCPDEGAVVGYGNWIRVKYPAKWGVQIAGMIFQTRSNVSSTLFYTCRFFCISSLNSLPLNNITATRNRKHINAPNILTVGFFTTLHKSKIPGRINPYPAAIIS